MFSVTRALRRGVRAPIAVLCLAAASVLAAFPAPGPAEAPPVDEAALSRDAAVPAQIPQAPGPLSAAHSALVGPDACAKCHNPVPKIDASRCLGCHKPVADRISGKRGVHREVTGDCEACHVEHKGVGVDLRPLDPKTFDHQAETGFSLEGRHGAAPAAGGPVCAKCHATRSYMALKPGCDTCHRDPHQVATGVPCASCHSPRTGFKNASRDFHKKTVFPLEGRHLTVPCASCHLNGAVKGTPGRCYDCHWIRRQDDPNRTRLGRDCENCHRPTAWTAVAWDHGARTGMPLNLDHRMLPCVKCHANREFRNFTPDCYACHRGDYERTQDPNHPAAGFPTDCFLCHKPSDTSFHQSRFNHGNIFALAGVHATQACSACHKSNVYAGTPRDCYGCHRKDYEGAKDPNHVAAGFPTTCDLCHKFTDPSFDRGQFNHGSFYPLLGVHAAQPCAVCHVGGVYKGTSTLCYSCHQAQYNRTTNPNHPAAGFPTTCEVCHKQTDTSFTQGVFNHAGFYPLLGVHAAQPCAACHVGGVYKGTSTLCYSCHQAQYNRTTNPNHPAAGFPTTCEVCHKQTDTSFTQGVFNHAGFYPLLGVHAAQPCAACHVGGVYKGTSTLCYSCHQAQYNKTTNPNHLGAGFPTTCEVCHKQTDASFTQGVFNHTYFPITTARHNASCSTCHIDSNNYKVFSCFACHTKSTTDAHHVGRAGYRYDSAACYACHPQGNG